MKKAFFLFACIAVITACNSNSSDSNSSSSTDSDNSDGIGTGPRSTDEDTAARNVYTVENANGNMPDTTNSINIGNDPKYRDAKDSTKH